MKLYEDVLLIIPIYENFSMLFVRRMNYMQILRQPQKIY